MRAFLKSALPKYPRPVIKFEPPKSVFPSVLNETKYFTKARKGTFKESEILQPKLKEI